MGVVPKLPGALIPKFRAVLRNKKGALQRFRRSLDDVLGKQRHEVLLSEQTRTDLGLPSNGSIFFISRRTGRFIEPCNADVFSAKNLKGNPMQSCSPASDFLQGSIAVVYVDIRDFTAIAEAAAPADIMALLNDFHNRMEMISLRHNGFMVEATGDMLLITFGIPTFGTLDATNALSCARDILDDQLQWNTKQAVTPPVTLGVGVHYGPAIWGKMGGRFSKAFAVIGDTVNVASRLQRLTRFLETDLVVSELLISKICAEGNLAETAGQTNLIQVGPQSLRGRSEKVNAYILPKIPLSA